MHTARVLVVIALAAALIRPQESAAQPGWAIACGDGRAGMALDALETASGARFTAHPLIPEPGLRPAEGCSGGSLAVDYDLSNVAPPGSANQGQSWVVVQRMFAEPKDLRPYTHLRLALRGSNLLSHATVELKLRDGTSLLPTVSLVSLADLPAWRTILIDLRELSSYSQLNLATITGFEIGIVRCEACETIDNPSQPRPADQFTGTLFLDELAAVDLKPGSPSRLAATTFEPVVPNLSIAAQAAGAILARVTPSGPAAGFVPTWFPEDPPTYNTYAQAEALLVFVYEYQRTGSAAYRDAARNLASRLIAQQIPEGRTHAGAWFTTYVARDGALIPPDRAVPASPATRCNGDETMVPDPQNPPVPVATNLDACMWVGNVGWALIALASLSECRCHDSPLALQGAIGAAADWLAGQPAYRANAAHPHLISLGIEGNISAYFGLRAAGRIAQARQLGDAIYQAGWDPVQRRMKPGARPEDAATALDVSGSWGATFLRAIGRADDALESQAYTASVLRTTSFDGQVFGYGDIAGPYTVSVEFGAQAAAAGMPGAADVMTQLAKLRRTEPPDVGAFPGAADHWYGGQLRPWSTTMEGVSPTAWVYFAHTRDPLWSLVEHRVSLPLALR